MEAKLTGEAFQIIPITPVKQLIRDRGETRWEWSVMAKEPGTKILYLTLNAIIDYKGKQINQSIQTFRKPIVVHVATISIVVSWINTNIGWIAGIFGTVLSLVLGYYLANLREKRKRDDDKKPKIILPK